MRIWLLIALAACGNKSKLDVVPGGDTDALWDLAPDGTEVGVVASPRALGLVMRGFTAVSQLAASPDFAPLKPQLDAITGALFGRPDATFADAGLTTDRGFAMFITTDGVIAVMPVLDRAKFMAAKHGTVGSGSADDTLDGSTCRTVRSVYMCATSEKMFARVGKGALRGKAMLAGGRGDLELFAPTLPLFGGAPADLAITAELDDGQIAVRGKWTGTPGGTLGALSGVNAPHPDATAVSGFMAFDLAKLIAGLPPVPMVQGVSFQDFAATLKGPVSATIPSGSVDIQLLIPLTDAKVATKVIDECNDLKPILDLTEQQTPGACRFRMQSASVIELEAWVDGNELRVGAHKGAPAAGAPSALTPIARELLAGDWTAMFWGRGTMVNLSGIAPATTDLPPQASAAIHAISLVNELGAGIKVDTTGVTMRGVMRTVWANPPEVIAKLVSISGDDIVRGKATDTGKALAAAAPSSPFATDFTAGQGGLMIPAAVLGIASALVVPAIGALFGGGPGDPSDEPIPEPPAP